MNRIRKTVSLSLAAGSFVAIAAASSVAAVAPENGGCVGQFASTGGTTDGRLYGALVSGAVEARHPFGATTVSYLAHSDRADCAFTYPPD
jgi:hypothetical protein